MTKTRNKILSLYTHILFERYVLQCDFVVNSQLLVLKVTLSRPCLHRKVAADKMHRHNTCLHQVLTRKHHAITETEKMDMRMYK